MTREEAIKKIGDELTKKHGTPPWSGEPFGDVLTVLEALGLVKFDEPKTPEQELHDALQRCMSEVNSGNPKVERAGHLTAYGAGCILDFIAQSGFKIVKDRAP